MATETYLVRDARLNPIQAFPLIEDQVNLTAAATIYSGVSLVHCVAAGDITLTHKSTATSTITCAVGDDYTIDNEATVTVVSGTFHLA